MGTTDSTRTLYRPVRLKEAVRILVGALAVILLDLVLATCRGSCCLSSPDASLYLGSLACLADPLSAQVASARKLQRVRWLLRLRGVLSLPCGILGKEGI